MESSLGKLGNSLKVPIVQELVKKKVESVPSRYIRPADHNQLIISSDQTSTPLPEIPIIDMTNLFLPEFMDAEILKLHSACKEWGFFQLVNHQVDWAAIEKMKKEMEEFFNLPLEEKMKYSQEGSDVEGYGQAFVFSEHQKLDWADLLYVVTLPTSLRKPHLIPKFPPPLREAVEAYSAELKTLAMKVLERMVKALGMKWEEMEVLFEEGMQLMRMNYYPPCPEPDLVTGISPHSDGGALTILMQLNEVDGLQVRKDGLWIPVSSLPNAFIINIGDMLEVVTNGEYRSVEHKASVNGEKTRLSIATFLSPKMDGELGPAQSLLNRECPPKFRRIMVADYLKGFFSKELKGKSFLDTMRLRSEPPEL